MRKWIVLAPFLFALFLMTLSLHAENKVIIDGIAMDGLNIVISSTPTPLPACTYTYSAWTNCINGIQARTIVSATPTGCTGTPVLSRTCSSPVPPGTLPWNTRIETGLAAGYEINYVANNTTSSATTLLLNIIGLTNETNVAWTWIFPDKRQFTGTALNTSLNGILNLRTAKGYSPNLPDYQYIPTGSHVLRIKGNADSRLVIRAVVY